MFGRTGERQEQRAEAWGRWMRRQHPMAIGSFVLGLLSLIEAGVLLVFAIAGIAMGVVALRQLRRSLAERSAGRALAWWGIALSAISLVIAVKFVYRWL